MHLYKGKKNKFWYAIFSVPNDDPDAKRPFKTIWKNTGMAKKKEAEIIADSWSMEKHRGTLPLTNKKITFKAFAGTEYLNWSKATKSHGAYMSNVYACKALTEFFDMFKMCDITGYLIEQYKIKRVDRVSQRTVNIELSCLKQMFSKAEEWGFIMKNPAVKTKKYPEPKKIKRFLSKEEISRLVENSTLWIKMFVYMALGTGMRSGEILNLRFDDIDLSQKQIFIRSNAESGYATKTRRDRVIPLDDRLAYIMNWFMMSWIDYHSMQVSGRTPEQRIYLFCDEKGNRIRSITHAFKKAVNRAGLKDVSPHTLRHTYASHMIMDGVDIRTVQEILGHTNIATTEIYTHLTTQHKLDGAKKLEYINSYRRFIGKGVEMVKVQENEIPVLA